MNISFHYFAVKSLALKAGFNETQAQQIAVFSQYIDDYNAYVFRRYSNIPDWVKKDPYDMYIPSFFNPMNFNPVTTGFWDMVDMATLMTSRSQQFTVSPFHFIPMTKDSMAKKDYRTVPATLSDGSIISNQLQMAKQIYQNAPADEKMDAAMLLGSRLHTFADTYAHQLFSGYDEACNNVSLVQVINNMTGADETQKYHSIVMKFLEALQSISKGLVPTIGHMMIEHIPDYPWLSFTMSYPLSDKTMGTYTRSNTSEFVKASKEILDYLRLCLNLPIITGDEWESFKSQLVDGFFFDETNYPDEGNLINALIQHWGMVFQAQGYQYSYDRHALFDGIVGGYSTASSSNEISQIALSSDMNAIFPSMSESFYKYNAYADDLLITLYGPKPRSTWYNDSAMRAKDDSFMEELDQSQQNNLVLTGGKPLI